MTALLCVYRGGCINAEQCTGYCRAPPAAQASKKRLSEMAEYMQACALIARNGADIHNGSKKLREHSDMVTAIASYLSSAVETPAPHAWRAVFQCSECKAVHRVSSEQPYFKVMEFQCLRCEAVTAADREMTDSSPKSSPAPPCPDCAPDTCLCKEVP